MAEVPFTRSHMSHPSDEELLLVADRECSRRRAANVREHLDQCPACHARMKALEGTLADFMSMHEERSQSRPSEEAGSRAALKMRLAQANTWSPRCAAAVTPWQLGAVCAALLLVAGSVWAMRETALGRTDRSAEVQRASVLPRKALTPGVTRVVVVDALCDATDSENDPPVTPSLEQAVFSEYGVPDSSKDNYEVDYLISPTLGGTNDIQNLWPEPHTSTSWGAHAKDDLENHLRELVCEGKLPLATAQHEIAADWIAAYKRYFHTDTPLAAATLASPPVLGGGVSNPEFSRPNTRSCELQFWPRTLS